tara:strand:+ start:599 stop:838 length:240 start_codon:yes stop_codon:yes gene_type:complete
MNKENRTNGGAGIIQLHRKNWSVSDGLNLMAEQMNNIHCLIQELENGVEITEVDYQFIYRYLEIAREYFYNLGEHHLHE